MKCTKERKKQLTVDLWIIFIATMAVLGIVLMGFGNQINQLAADSSVNILLRVLIIGLCGQFGIAGLGITIVCLIRKESFLKFGLNTKNLFPALGLSLLCCVPDFVCCLINGRVHAWCPFWDVNTTPEVLSSAFPYNVLAFLVTALCWGFFEGFNYVVIRDKISELYPSKHRFFDWGALVCAVMCILVHGAVGVTPDALIEMLTTMILIYGMLIVRKETGNAWGCVLIFFVYWNAL
ncbi:MAG: hypothetical protein IJ035_10315 [Oscillospiraceae bacterium]|nr:hypothetical protein [Oscillospiraceae bacterium]